MKHYFILLFMIYWFLWLQACRPKPPEPDPCLGKNPVTADFHIYEGFPGGYPDGWELYDTDTVATGSVIFKALEEGAQYEWRLGRETIRERSFARSDFPRGTTIPVSLKVTKTPDNDCFPEDSGIVTKIRWFYTTPSGCENRFSNLKGRFRGYNSDNPDKLVTIEIDPCFRPPEDRLNRTFPRIINLVSNCDLYAFSSVTVAYKQFYFNRHLKCNHPRGLIRIYGIDNDSIKINYDLRPDILSQDIIPKIFNGIRIN